jgi:hypothetical protein
VQIRKGQKSLINQSAGDICVPAKPAEPCHVFLLNGGSAVVARPQWCYIPKA